MTFRSGVAERSRRGLIGALAIAAIGSAVACDSPTEVSDAPYVYVGDVTMEAVGDTVRLEARVEHAAGAVVWESLDPDVVLVSATGVAVARASGEARVRARVGSLADEGVVTVLPAVDVRVSELRLVTDATGREGIAMRIRNLGGRGHYRLEHWKQEEDGSHRRILWYNSDSDAPVGLDIEASTFLGDERPDWVIAYSRQPRSAERAMTGCARLDGGDACPPDAPSPQPGPAPVVSVEVTPAAAVMEIGEEMQYTARAFAENGEELTDRPVVWSTPSPGVIAIDSTGLVRALAAGYGEVRATVEGVTSAVGLTVATPAPVDPVAHVQLEPRWHWNWVGQGYRFRPRVMNTEWEELYDRPVEWSARDTAVATVDSTGLLHFVGEGETAVVATVEGITGAATIRTFERPTTGASLGLAGLISIRRRDDPPIQPSFPTTWVDSAGHEREAWIQVSEGALSMDWTGGVGSYEQRVTLKTFILDGMAARVVEVVEYVDTGTLRVLWDWFLGDQVFGFESDVTEGLRYAGRWTVPGELEIQQAVGPIGVRGYYFHLE